MAKSTIKRFIGILATAIAVAGLAMPAAAQGSRSSVQAQINALANRNPGSALVYAGCRAAADGTYRNTGSLDRALGTLVGCASLGCALTDSYRNCLDVNARLFVLELRLL
jgi:hypothetical protein